MCVYCIHYQLSSPFVLCHTPSIRLHLFHLHWALTNAIHGSDCMLSKRLLPIHTTIRGLLRTQWHGHFFVRCITMWTVPSCSNNRPLTKVCHGHCIVCNYKVVHRSSRCLRFVYVVELFSKEGFWRRTRLWYDTTHRWRRHRVCDEHMWWGRSTTLLHNPFSDDPREDYSLGVDHTHRQTNVQYACCNDNM